MVGAVRGRAAVPDGRGGTTPGIGHLIVQGIHGLMKTGNIKLLSVSAVVVVICLIAAFVYMQ